MILYIPPGICRYSEHSGNSISIGTIFCSLQAFAYPTPSQGSSHHHISEFKSPSSVTYSLQSGLPQHRTAASASRLAVQADYLIAWARGSDDRPGELTCF